MRYSTIAVKHNIEVAHRLFLLPGKCENIHGHSMWVTMNIEGELNSKGILEGIEYGDLKQMFRAYLDQTFDHHLLLNADDPWSKNVFITDSRGNIDASSTGTATRLPGLQVCPGDPTTENLAFWIAQYMEEELKTLTGHELPSLQVDVWETAVNMASYNIDNTIP